MDCTNPLVHKNGQNRRRQGRSWKGFSFLGGDVDGESELNPNMESELNPSHYPLSQAKQGSFVWVVGFRNKGGNNRLLGMGLASGVKLKIVNAQTSGSVIVSIQSTQMGLGAEIAQNILVRNEPLIKEEDNMAETQVRTYLREMAVSTIARVVGYDKTMRSYKGKLLSMGLTPKTEFTVVRVAPLGDPVEIQVRGFNLSLRKQESDALIVEVVSDK